MSAAHPQRPLQRLRTYAVLALLLLALTLRGAIPAGYMPGHDKDGNFHLLSLCVSPHSGPDVLAWLAGLDDTAHPDGPETGAAMQACAFAVLAHQALGLPDTNLAVATHLWQQAPTPAPRLYIRTSKAVPTGPTLGPRGPPPLFSSPTFLFA